MTTPGRTQPCDTYSQQLLHGMLLALSPCPEEPSARACHNLFERLYRDMLACPQGYALPLDAYPDRARELDDHIRQYLAASKIRDPKLSYLLGHQARKGKARGAIRSVFDFLLLMGEAGELRGDSLRVPRAVFRAAVDKRAKWAREPRFLDSLGRLGFRFEWTDDFVLLSNGAHPGLFPAFQALSKACAGDKKRRFLFCRCDFSALDPNFKWTLGDVIRTLPPRDRDLLADIDDTMKRLKYRTVIEFEDRYAYALKQGVILRVQVEYDAYHLYFRWPLKAALSQRVFEKLHDASPALCASVFEQLIPCRPDCNPGYGASGPERCGARVEIEYGGRRAHTCTDAGWPVWGHERGDFENVKIVARAIREAFDENPR